MFLKEIGKQNLVKKSVFIHILIRAGESTHGSVFSVAVLQIHRNLEEELAGLPAYAALSERTGQKSVRNVFLRQGPPLAQELPLFPCQGRLPGRH